MHKWPHNRTPCLPHYKYKRLAMNQISILNPFRRTSYSSRRFDGKPSSSASGGEDLKGLSGKTSTGKSSWTITTTLKRAKRKVQRPQIIKKTNKHIQNPLNPALNLDFPTGFQGIPKISRATSICSQWRARAAYGPSSWRALRAYRRGRWAAAPRRSRVVAS